MIAPGNRVNISIIYLPGTSTYRQGHRQFFPGGCRRGTVLAQCTEVFRYFPDHLQPADDQGYCD